ncbi:MAG: glycosyl hydrolase, partial [Planctomycetota bacterium]
DAKFRFQWNYPLFFSPHDPGRLYAAAQVLFQSDDLGQSWQQISPDLTRNDPTKLGSSGGPITKDNTGVEYYCTIFAACESPLQKGLLWCGSDDGLIHVSRDAGASWANVTPEGLPAFTVVNCIDADPFRAGGLYVAATNYKADDFRPYLFHTSDYGATWRDITGEGLAADHFTRAIRADTARPGLLYAGTERGVHVSLDDGATWRSLQGDLPIVPVTDLAVRGDELVAATQGRGYWILNGLDLLRAFDAVDPSVHLFAPEPTYRVGMGGGRRRSGASTAGQNPPGGVGFRYWLGAEPAKDAVVRLEILDADQRAVRTLTRRGSKDGAREDRVLDVAAGLQDFRWDMRWPGARAFDDMVLWNRSLSGPLAVPGTYTARLTVGEEVRETTFEIRPDPRTRATEADHVAQWEFLSGVVQKLDDIHRALQEVREVRPALEEFEARLPAGDDIQPLRDELASIRDRMRDAEETLYQTKSQSAQDPLNFPVRLNDKLAGLNRLSGGFGPTTQQQSVRDELFEKIEAPLGTLRAILDEEIAELDAKARAAGVPAIRRD